MKKSMVLVLAMGLVMALSSVAMADQATVDVSANVVGVCKFLTGGGMDFGGLDPSTGVDKNATVTQPTFWCTKGTIATISDDLGKWESGVQRRVKHASLDEYLNWAAVELRSDFPTVSMMSDTTLPLNLVYNSDRERCPCHTKPSFSPVAMVNMRPM